MKQSNLQEFEIISSEKLISYGHTNIKSMNERKEKLEKHLEELNKIKEIKNDILGFPNYHFKASKGSIGRMLKREERMNNDLEYVNKKKIASKKSRDKIKKLGLCLRCKKELTDKKHVYCLSCRTKF